MSIKIILFNASPGSGKDFAKHYLCTKGAVYPFEFKSRLFELTRTIYGIPRQVWESWYTSKGKEVPRNELDNLSCRQALIKVSEEVIKPVFGKSYFGRAAAKEIHSIYANDKYVAAVCSDNGFNEEVEPFIQYFPPEDIYIVQIHREGCSFEGDSRNWVDTDVIPDENYISIVNDGTESFKTILDDTYTYIMSR